jgi:hypothetical protein
MAPHCGSVYWGTDNAKRRQPNQVSEGISEGGADGTELSVDGILEESPHGFILNV